MKNIFFKTFILLFTIAICSSCSKETVSDKEEMKLNSYSEIEREILDLVNDHRRKLGLSTLKMHRRVYEEAESHNDFMIDINRMTHKGFGKRSNRIIRQSGAYAVGENLGIGYKTAKEVFEAWLKSKKHRETIEREGFNYTGISVKRNEKGRHFYTQLFIKK